MGLTKPLFSVLARDFSGRDLVLIGGGLFLLVKSTLEIHSSATGEAHERSASSGKSSFGGTLVQIAVLDITAVGMAQHLPVMILAVIIAVGVMMLASGAIARFVDANPTIKILALAFLILVGV